MAYRLAFPGGDVRGFASQTLGTAQDLRSQSGQIRMATIQTLADRRQRLMNLLGQIRQREEARAARGEAEKRGRLGGGITSGAGIGIGAASIALAPFTGGASLAALPAAGATLAEGIGQIATAGDYALPRSASGAASTLGTILVSDPLEDAIWGTAGQARGIGSAPKRF
jgi:hypothetical protein